MLWIKALHVISVIAWMAGLLYLPRLYVYHAGIESGSAQSETFKVMERRLYFGIMSPAMAASWVMGLWMVLGYGVVDWSEGWVWVKAALVIFMTIYHFMLGTYRTQFASDRNVRPARYFRLINEIPTVLMIGIVIAVIVRPF